MFWGNFSSRSTCFSLQKVETKLPHSILWFVDRESGFGAEVLPDHGEDHQRIKHPKMSDSPSQLL